MKKLIFLVTILIIGCSRSHKEAVVTGNVAVINIDSIKKDDLSPKILEISYIPLEISDKSLVGCIDNILYFEKKFYIYDNIYAKAVFVFDNNGKFISKIGGEGRGPGEILYHHSFDIDEQGNVYIFDEMAKKIKVFSYNGDFIREFDVPLRFLEFARIDDDKGFFRYGVEKGNSIIGFGIYNSKKNKIFPILECRKVFDDGEIVNYTSHCFYKSDSSIFFNPRFTNKILRLSKDGTVKEDIRIDPDVFPDEKFVLELGSNPAMPFLNQDVIWDIRNIYENDDFTSFLFTRGFTEFTVFISRSTGNKVCFKSFDPGQYLGDKRIQGVADDMFVSVIQPEMYSEKDWVDKIEKLSVPETEKAKLRSLSAADNPTLVLLKFERF